MKSPQQSNSQTPSQTIVITGGSAGIGAAVARRFDEPGNNIVLLARRKEKLKQVGDTLTKARVVFHSLDITSRSDVEEVFAKILSDVGPVDLLINNAGVAFGLDPAQKSDLEEWEKCVDVNVKGLLYCTHAVLPSMVERNQGQIINLGSTAGSYPYPGGNVYCGTKAFVHQFSLSLRSDLLGTAIRVSCVEPGLVGGTEFSMVRFRGDASKAKGAYEKTKPLTPEDIAEVIFFTASIPPHVNLNTIEMMPVCQAPASLSVHKS